MTHTAACESVIVRLFSACSAVTGSTAMQRLLLQSAKAGRRQANVSTGNNVRIGSISLISCSAIMVNELASKHTCPISDPLSGMCCLLLVVLL